MKISRDETKALKLKQERDETDDQSSSSESDNETDEEDKNASKNWEERGTWGETSEDITRMMEKRRQKKKKKKRKLQSDYMETGSETEIADEERLLLMNEFISTMYKSFIDGNDADFDYRFVITSSLFAAFLWLCLL